MGGSLSGVGKRLRRVEGEDGSGQVSITEGKEGGREGGREGRREGGRGSNLQEENPSSFLCRVWRGWQRQSQHCKREGGREGGRSASKKIKTGKFT